MLKGELRDMSHDKENLVCYRCKKKVKESYMLHDRIIRCKDREVCLSCFHETCKHTALGYDDYYIHLDPKRRAIMKMVCEECGGKIYGLIKVDKMLAVSSDGKELDL